MAKGKKPEPKKGKCPDCGKDMKQCKCGKKGKGGKY